MHLRRRCMAFLELGAAPLPGLAARRSLAVSLSLCLYSSRSEMGRSVAGGGGGRARSERLQPGMLSGSQSPLDNWISDPGSPPALSFQSMPLLQQERNEGCLPNRKT